MKLLIWTVLLLQILAGVTTADNVTRVKRFVGFRPNSKFFLRINVKDTILQATPIFAHVAGFKVTWPGPVGTGFPKRRPIRALLDDVEFLFDRHGFDGKSCLLNNICQAAEYVNQKSGVMVKILKLLLRYSSNGKSSSLPDAFDCEEYKNLCPLEFIGTDMILE